MSNHASRPNLEFLRKQAKTLHRAYQQEDPDAGRRITASHPRASGGDGEALSDAFSLQDAQLVIAREQGHASWPRLVVACAASEGGQARERVLTDARGTRHRDDVPRLTATWFRAMRDLGVLSEGGITHLVLIDGVDGWMRIQGARLNPRRWGINYGAKHLVELDDVMVMQRMTRSMEEAEERAPEQIRDWREGRSWWRLEADTPEAVRNLLLNDYRADEVPQEFLELYSGERYAACVAFKQGIIRWADNSFSEEYLDIVKELSEGLSRGLPELGPLR